MKHLGYILSTIFTLLLVVMVAIMQGPIIILVSLYFGLFTYFAFKSSVKKVAIVGLIITILLIIESLILNSISIKPATTSLTSLGSLFPQPTILFVLSIGIIFVAVPALVSFLEGLVEPDQDGLARSSLLVLLYVILTLGIYQIYWFWLIKKALLKQNIQTVSLWWFLLPVVGMIIIYIDFSKALEKRTQKKFILWFLIFLCVQGLDVVINQAIINSVVKKE